jgi:hypothetical protein
VSAGAGRSDRGRATPTAAIRGAWGMLLVTAPAEVAGVLHLHRSRQVRSVLRLLGLRHLVQAAITGATSSRKVTWASVVVDASHGLSALAYGASAPHRRRAGLSLAAVATAFAVTGFPLTRGESD